MRHPLLPLSCCMHRMCWTPVLPFKAVVIVVVAELSEHGVAVAGVLRGEAMSSDLFS